MRFAAFFVEEKPFPLNGTDLQIVAMWRYEWCAGKFSKSEKNGCKVCAHFDYFELEENVYHKVLPHVL